MEHSDPSYNRTYQLRGKLRAIQDRVIVEDLVTGETTTEAGLVIIDDNAKERGIHPRWGKVYAIGPLQEEVFVGQWILVEHGRWTRGLSIIDHNNEEKTIRMVDNDDIMMVSDEPPPEHSHVSTIPNTTFDSA